MQIVRYFGMVAAQESGSGVAGVRVEAWDTAGVLADAVAITTTGPDGRFSFAVSRADVDRLFAGRRPVVKLKVVSGTMLLADTQSSHTWHLRDHARGRIDVNPALPIGIVSAGPRLSVRGTLRDVVTGPMTGATVQAFDRNVTAEGVTETLLGSDTTDARGRFRIAFENRHLGRPGKEVPDLVIRAGQGGTTLAEAHACAALPITEVELVRGGEVFLGRGEYAWLLETLDGLRGGVDWRAISTQQAELLACSARVDRAAATALAAAARLAFAVPAIPEEAFFALLRHGLPTASVALFSHRPVHLRKTLEKAITSGTISHVLWNQLDGLQQAFEDASVLASFDVRPSGVGLGTLVSHTPGVSTAAQHSFVRKVLQHAGDAASFWALLALDSDLSSHVAPLRFTMEIAPLVANHTPMIDELQSRRTAGQLQRADDLAKLLPGDWQELVGTTGVPTGTPGQTPAQQQDNYIAWLDRTVEARFRTARIADRIGRAEPTADITTFFNDNPGFRFESSRVARYLAEQPGALVNIPENNRFALTDQLTKLERLFRVSRSYEQMAALDSAGLTSALAIHRKGKTRFLFDHAAALGGTSAAEEVFVRACWAVSSASAILGKFASKVQTGAAVLPDMETTPGGLPSAVADWPTLFGSLDACACEHCQSVLGSSAYLVDLLQFLDRQPAGAGTGRDLLLAKRPDLQRLELSCKTSDTPLPYVDLVNEVMEVALLAGQSPSTPWPTSTGMTSGTAEELLAAPDILYPDWHLEAGNLLAGAVHPFDLPFHLWNEEARVHLHHLGVPRSELMAAFEPSQDPFSDALVAERLGMSPRQRDVVAGVSIPGATLASLWGYPANDAAFPAQLAGVQTFLRKAGLSYDELLELIATGRYNSLIIPLDAGCELSTMTWNTPAEADLLEAHRFLRLRRALGWSITDLGKATAALGFIGTTTLQKLAAVQALRGKLGAEVPVILGFFADMDRNGAFAPSLFERLFLKRTAANPEDPAFKAVFNDPGGAPSPPQLLVDHKGGILAAVGASAQDLDLVMDAAVAGAKLALLPALSGPGSADLTLANLSRIHRIFALARALRLPVGDLRVLCALSSTAVLAGDPQPGLSPAATLTFVDVATRVRRSGLQIPEIHYLTRHVAGADDPFVLPEKDVDQLLARLEAAVQSAAMEAEKASDPSGRQVESLLASALSDPQATAALLAVLNGTSLLDRSQRLQLIEDHLSSFVEDVVVAKHRLVGTTDHDPDFLSTPDERFDYLVRRLLRHAIAAASVKQVIGAALGLTPSVVDYLLSTPVLAAATAPGRGAIFDFVCGDAPPAPAGTEATRRAHVLRLHKASLLLRRLRLGAEEISLLYPSTGAPSPGGLPWIDLNALPVSPPSDFADLTQPRQLFSQILRFVDLAALRDRWPAGASGLLALFELAVSGSLTDVEAELAKQTGLAPAEVHDVLTHLGVTIEALRNETGLLRFERAIALVRRLGVSAKDAIQWANTDLPLPVPGGDPGVLAVTRDIQRAARAKYSSEAWTSVARPLRDAVRERQRGALVSCLLAQRNHDHPAQLYEDLLIDVEMSPCLLTSRTVQAVATVQLFIQRAFLHLEGTFSLDEEAAREWEWLKSYRVWEANRKVFLYPENWIEPELRDDKTPLFRDFESRLSQGPLTHASAEKAIQSYVEGLHEIAHLDVVAVAEEDEADPDAGITAYVSAPRRILHIFGRTSPPHAYHYRTCREGLFSPWEKIDLDIQAEHLVPVVHNRRLYLFWPELLERSPSNAAWLSGALMKTGSQDEPNQGQPDDPEEEDEKSPPPGASSEEPPPKRLYLTLAYSEYKSRRWTKRRIEGGSAVPVPIDVPPNEPTPRDFLDPVFFLGRSSGSSIVVDACLVKDWASPSLSERFARFELDPCSAAAIAPGGVAGVSLAVPANTKPRLQAFEGGGSLELVTDVHEDDLFVETIFASAPASYTLVADRSKEPATPRDVLFYKDGKRTFLLERRAEQVLTRLAMSKFLKIQGLGGSAVDIQIVTGKPHVFEDATYRARIFYHPYACTFVKRLAQHGVSGLLRWAGQAPPVQLTTADVSGEYAPNPEAIETPLPVEDVDFTAGGSYSAYNWELFFHAPLLVATRLDAEHRHEEADRWYRYIFDPADGSGDEAPSRFWKVRPFHENKHLADMLTELSALAADEHNTHLLELDSLANSKPKTPVSESFAAQIAAWRKDPFNPHAIARLRPAAYQKHVVMRYIDHLLAWGDRLFRMDTRESVAEATQLYLYASHLLGPRPTTVRKAHPPQPKSYSDLVAVDGFSNALVEVETLAPPPPVWGAGCGEGAPPPETVWGTLYFCIPPNDKLLRCWDIVADRLLKIRCCMNIEGTRRDLPLFEPPIDPGILVKARAAGVDISSVLADLYAGAPIYRFAVLHARAVELAGYVSSLGAGLLSALEKRDGERLSILRTTHEIRLAQAVRQIKKRQIDEAREQLSALDRSRAVVDERRRHYTDIPRRIAAEDGQLTKMDLAVGLHLAAESASAAAGPPAAVPDTRALTLGLAGAGTDNELPGGKMASRLAGLAIAGLHAVSYVHSQDAAKLGIEAGYQRREAEWALQKRLAERELAQIDKQLAAARIRLEIAENDMAVHDQTIENAREVEAFFRDKLTNEDLYDWLIQRASTLHFQAYRLAYQMARRAERAYQFERGDDDDTFIAFDSWDSARSGLLSGERLLLDLRRLEAAYLERNKREYEITKHVSLAALAPRELLALRETGEAALHLQEKHFDQDFPTHYLRRLKAVSLSMPCVTGPYQGVHAKLTLLAGEARKAPTGGDMLVSRGAIQSIVTSSAQNDGGQFELVFRDDRYLPFEGVGAHTGASSTPQWRLGLSRSTNRFRFDSIADVLLHLRYTARDGRVAAAPDPFEGAWLFSASSDFPDAWRAFVDSDTELLTVPFAAALFCRPEAMPGVTIKKVSFYTRAAPGASLPSLTMAITQPTVTLSQGVPIGALVCWEATAPAGGFEPVEWKLDVTGAGLTHAAFADVWIAVDYEATATA